MDNQPGLRDLLSGYRVDALRDMVAAGRGAPESRTKAGLVEHLAVRFADPERVASAAKALDTAARAVLERVQLAGTAVDAQMLRDVLEAEGLIDPPVREPRTSYRARRRSGDPRDRRSRDLRDVLARLELVGLLLGDRPSEPGASVIEFGLGLAYTVPGEVRPHLPPPAPLAAGTPEIRHHVSGDPAAFSRELFLIWSFIWTRRPTLLSTTGTLSKRDLAALAGQLPFEVDVKAVKREDELPRIHVPRRMLDDLELVTGGAVLEADEAAARRFWAAPLAERIAACLKLRIDARWHNELQHLPGVQWEPRQRDDRKWAPDQVINARVALARHVGRLAGAGDWVAVSSFGEALRLSDPHFLLGAPSSGYGYRTYHATPSYANRYRPYYNPQGWSFFGVDDTADGWLKVEATFAVRVLVALHRLGLVDLGMNESRAVTAFRLSPMGRHLLAGAPAPTEQTDPGARVVLQPNFHVVAVGAVAEATLLELERFSDRLSADRVVEFELTRESLYRAQRAGLDAAAVVARLEQLTGTPVPQNVARTLAEWQTAHERIVVRLGANLIQAADKALMAELAEAAGSALRPLSPTFALVRDDERLHKLLRERELVPAEGEGAGDAPGARMSDDGVVVFSQQVPGLRLLGRVQSLAEWDADASCWRLTRVAVQRARTRYGLDAAAQVKAWRAALEPPLPDWLERRVKAWGGHYGAAKLHRSMLLELPSEEALRALRENPQLRKRLRRVKPRGPLVAVDGEDPEGLADLLADYGIEIEDT